MPHLRRPSVKPNVCIPHMQAKMRLTMEQLEALKLARDYGPTAVVKRNAGARSRMCKRLVAEGLMTGPPFEITLAGRTALKQRGM